jgi:hypothetical protein
MTPQAQANPGRGHPFRTPRQNKIGGISANEGCWLLIAPPESRVGTDENCVEKGKD